MEKIKKIYCVLCDGMPFLPELRELASKYHLRVIRQISNCTTDASLTRMFTGKMPSDYISQGFGFHTNQLEQYRDSKTLKINLPWYNETVLAWFHEINWKIHLHNVIPDSWYFGDTCTDSYEGGYENRLRLITHKYHRFYSRRMMDEILLNDDPNWQKRELQFIRNLDTLPAKTFYFFDYLHFHGLNEYIRVNTRIEGTLKKKLFIKRVIELLEAFPFDEPNTLIWFFSDHGTQRAFNVVPPIEAYLSWVITNAPIMPKLISIQDFPRIIKGLIKTKVNPRYLKKDRIFYVEDGRIAYDMMHSTTASAIKIIQWQRNIPIEFFQVCYFINTKQFYYSRHRLSKEGFLIKTSTVDKQEISRISLYSESDEEFNELRRYLIKRFDWIKETC